MQEVTLLLTDVVDSTRWTEQLGDEAMTELWRAHDRFARDLLAAHEGREIDRTDGFLLLFASVDAAVDYSIGYHQGLSELATPLLARVGVHVGEAHLFENCPRDVSRGAKPIEVEGLAKPVAARIMTLARGGQTLLSSSAYRALGQCNHHTTSHGYWRLKGIIDPVELFEVGEDGAPFRPPLDHAKAWAVVRQDGAWHPVRDIEHTLPRERDAFIGRHADLIELAAQLDGGAALISLLGIGGTGKTRLATRYGWTWLGAWPGGVYFCDLSDARSLAGIVSSMGRGLRIPVTARDPVRQIGLAIEARGKCLVILDNFEQVTAFAADTLGKWLDVACEAQFVVTTREVLGLPGERAMALRPLTQAHAVALFEERAAAAKRGFALADVNRAVVSELVELLDRLPLAIELCAARARMMSPSAMLQRMDKRFKLLTSAGGRHDRQATLRAAIDWSWDLLSQDERAGLAQLSTFEGGFALEAAEAVLDCGSSWGTDILRALVDKSLVRQSTDSRFDLLVSVRAYASEKLVASGQREATWLRHAEHYAELDDHGMWQTLGVEPSGPQPEHIYRELGNVVMACRRCVATGQWALARRNSFVAGFIASRDGPSAAGFDALHALDALGQLDARGWTRLGVLLRDDGRGDEALAAWRRATTMDEGGTWEALAMGLIAILYAQRGDAERATACLEHVRPHEILGDYRTFTRALLCENRSDYAQTELLFREWHANREARGQQVGPALLNVSVAVALQGRDAEAIALCHQAIHHAGREGCTRHAWGARSNLGELVARRGELEEGLVETTAAVRGLRAMGQATESGRLAASACMLMVHAGALEAAVTQGKPALATLENAGHGHRFEAHVCLGVAYRLLRQFSEARYHLSAAVDCPLLRFEVLGRTHLALLELDEGSPDAALKLALVAMERRREAGEFAGHPCIVLAQVHIAQARFDEARAVLDIAWSDKPPPQWAAELHGCEALLAARLGDRAMYEQHLQTLTKWPQLGHPDSPHGRVLARATEAMASRGGLVGQGFQRSALCPAN